MQPFDYHEPATVPEALELLDRHAGDVLPMAGGTALALLMGQGLTQPGHVVGLRRIQALRGIRARGDGGLELGALVTHAEAEHSAAVAAHTPALQHAFAQVATVRIRNQATVGGNLAHADPAQDPPPMLMALDAEAVVDGPASRRQVPLHELFADYLQTTLDDGELLTAVVLPPPVGPARATYQKFLPRTHDDYATVAVAAWVARGRDGRCVGARIALGGAAAVPVRAWRAEALLHGATLDPDVIAAAADAVAEDVDPIADARGSADYKREMARVWTGRALRHCRDQQPNPDPAGNGRRGETGRPTG